VSRLGGAFLLGVGVTGAALAFESRPLAVAGVGLLLAAGVARVWAGSVRGPASVRHLPEPMPATEGDRVRLRVETRRVSGTPVASCAAHGSLGRLGDYQCRLSGHGRAATGAVDLGRLPRGRFPVTDARLVLGDHLGLAAVSIPLDAAAASVVVHPRLVELQGLFSEAGRQHADGRRLLLRRPAGFDFHSVREYEQGESLRRVHWPTTARRGQLMVKELDDAPRDAVVVFLDCDPTGAVGEPPESSFDMAVRAAGSVLRLYAARGRRATLLTTGAGSPVVQVTSLEGDFAAALDVLAAAEADAPSGLGRALGHELTLAARAGELVIVTTALEPGSVEALLGAAPRRLVSLVWIDAASYAGRPTHAHPPLLRLSTAGIAVAVVRRGDDLAERLDVPRLEGLARA
jgi:uncharacterized protein (DUF58 family)